MAKENCDIVREAQILAIEAQIRSKVVCSDGRCRGGVCPRMADGNERSEVVDDLAVSAWKQDEVWSVKSGPSFN